MAPVIRGRPYNSKTWQCPACHAHNLPQWQRCDECSKPKERTFGGYWPNGGDPAHHSRSAWPGRYPSPDRGLAPYRTPNPGWAPPRTGSHRTDWGVQPHTQPSRSTGKGRGQETGFGNANRAPPKREPTEVEKAIEVQQVLRRNGCTDLDTIRKIDAAVETAQWKRDAQWGPEYHSQALQKRIDAKQAAITRQEDAIAEREQQLVEERAKLTALQQGHEHLLQQKIKVDAEPPPAAKGAVAFRSAPTSDLTPDVLSLLQLVDNNADALPWESLRPAINRLRLAFARDVPAGNDDDTFGEAMEDHAELDEDAVQPFYDAAQAIQALRENPDQLDSLRKGMEESFQLATRRRSRIDNCKPYGR